MVRLNNINRDNNFIWCDYIPNGNGEAGFIKINADTGRVHTHTKPDRTDYHPWFVYYAIKCLMEIKDLPVIPTTTSIAWY